MVTCLWKITFNLNAFGILSHKVNVKGEFFLFNATIRSLPYLILHVKVSIFLKDFSSQSKRIVTCKFFITTLYYLNFEKYTYNTLYAYKLLVDGLII